MYQFWCKSMHHRLVVTPHFITPPYEPSTVPTITKFLYIIQFCVSLSYHVWKNKIWLLTVQICQLCFRDVAVWIYKPCTIPRLAICWLRRKLCCWLVHTKNCRSGWLGEAETLAMSERQSWSQYSCRVLDWWSPISLFARCSTRVNVAMRDCGMLQMAGKA